MKYGGSFIKGFSSGISGGLSNIMNMQQLKWQKEQREQLEKDKEAYKEAIGMFQSNNQDLFDELNVQGAGNAGLSLITNAFAISDDFGRAIKEYTLAINSNNREAAEQAHEKMQLITDYMLKLQLGGGELAENWSVEDFVSEESKKWIRARDVYKATPTSTMPYEMTKEMAGMAGFKGMPEAMPTTPKTELDIMGETKKKLDYAYATGNANHFNQVAKSLNIPTTFDTYGQTPGAGVAEKTPPTAPSIENVRVDIKDADTVEDARRIHKNHIAKYGEQGLEIDNVDKFWAEGQTVYLNNIKQALNNITNEKGQLKKGTLTSAEVGVDFQGTQKVEEIYEMLRKEYMKYRDELKKLGIDISQFPELLTLEEYKKADILHLYL